MSDTQTVYVPERIHGSRTGTYHTDPDCQYVEQAHDTKPVEADSLPEDWRECHYCKHDDNPGGNGSGHIQSLKRAAANQEP